MTSQSRWFARFTLAWIVGWAVPAVADDVNTEEKQTPVEVVLSAQLPPADFTAKQAEVMLGLLAQSAYLVNDIDAAQLAAAPSRPISMSIQDPRSATALKINLAPTHAPSAESFAWRGSVVERAAQRAVLVVRKTARVIDALRVEREYQAFLVVLLPDRVLVVDPFESGYVTRVFDYKEDAHRCHVRHVPPQEDDGASEIKPSVTNSMSPVINVAFTYTEKTRQLANYDDGLIRGRIDTALTLTNDALSISDVDVQFYAVCKEADPTFILESPKWEENLDRLVSDGDKHYDLIHSLRTSKKADLGCLIVAVGGNAANVLECPTAASKTEAFSMVNWGSLIPGKLVLAHELAHNLGCCHEPTQTDCSCTAHSHPHTFQTSGGENHTTIMNVTGIPDRIPHFSNPQVNYLGEPTGTAAANNASTLTTNAVIVEAFY